MRSRIWLLVAVLPLMVLAGCGGGSAAPPPPVVSISILSSQASVPAGGTASFAASVTGTSNHSVTWKVNGTTGGDANVGMIDALGRYTAPMLVPSPAQLTITAVSQADSKKSASATLTVTLAVAPSSAWLPVNDPTCTQAFAAIGQGAAGLDWVLKVNGAPADPSYGAIDASGVYTPPAAAPFPPRLNVTAASQADATQTGSATAYLGASGPLVDQWLQLTPVQLGTSGGNASDNSGNFCCSGTLGALVTRSGTNFILSNNHVLARSDLGKIGETITQPGLVDSQCGSGVDNIIAKLSQFAKLKGHPNNIATADAALAQVISGQVDPAGAILGLGAISCGIPQPAPPANTTIVPAIGMPVAKSGRTSGITCGTIAVVNVAVQVQYTNTCGSNAGFVVNYDNQVEIDSTTFSAPGDSGSLIVDSQTAQPTALLYAGDSTSTIGNPIQDVLAALADPTPPHALPTFVGGGTYAVATCSGPRSGAVAVNAVRLTDQEIARARTAKENHATTLMADPAVVGVGVGESDTPGEAAIVLFVDKEKTPGSLPLLLDGVKTKIKLVNRFRAFAAACPAGRSREAGVPLR
ncbi:MAG: S1 family peptidase [Acidobacteriia bacterium]|nr:S1 family peptidase [Terriglobia bacterium]